MSEFTPSPEAPEVITPEGNDLPSSDERNMALLAHLLGIFFSILPALLIWLLKKDESEYINDQAKEALNFQITMLIAYFVASLTMYIVIGCILAPVLLVVDLVLCIVAAVAVSKGQRYRYPFALRLIS